MGQFTTQFKAEYYGIQNNMQLSFPRYMAYLQETSILHTSSVGYPLTWFQDAAEGFVLVNWQVSVAAYPTVYQDMVAITYPTVMKGILAERYFEVQDTEGQVLLRANSRWAYNSFAQKRPIRIPAAIVQAFSPTLDSPLARDYNLPEKTGFEFTARHAFTAPRRDMDTNGHINNIRYLDWAVDTVPDEIHDRYAITGMKAVYKKECAKGDPIRLETYQKDTEFLVHILSRDGNTHAEIYLNYGDMAQPNV